MAVALEAAPAPAASSQTTSTITHLQLGCQSACFGTTTPDPSTAALTQLVLSQLSSLQPPSGSGGLQPVPALLQNVVQQAACQVQESSGSGTQVQAASQTTAVIQVTSGTPADLGSTQPAGTIVDQTQQQIWQLQIGCLFYCVDTQQVQEAQQSTVVVVSVAGPATSRTTTIVVSQQTIWQLQVGCLAWCWDSTQLQQAGTESTIAVGAAPPAGDGPQAPPPSPGPPGEPAAAAAPAPASVPGASGPRAPAPATSPSAPATRADASIQLLTGARKTGLAIVGARFVASALAPPRAVSPVSGPAPAGRWRVVSTLRIADSATVTSTRVAASHPHARQRPILRSSSRSPVPAALLAQPAVSAASDARALLIIGLVLLALAGVVSIEAFRRAAR